jgi:hypothetical protein
MGGMHQAPTRIHWRMVEQPLHRALTTPSQASIDLSSLFGDVDVHWGRSIHGVQTGQGFAQAVGRHGAQRVWCQTQASALGLAQRLELLQQGQHVVGGTDEATLANAGRCAAKAAGLVEHGQQGQANACTGDLGLIDSLRATQATADRLGLAAEEVPRG